MFFGMGRRDEPYFPDYDEGKIAGLDVAFAVILQRLRKQHQMSQEELALRSGMGRTFISLLERAQRRPSLSTLFQLSRALEISPVEFVQAVDDQLRHRPRS